MDPKIVKNQVDLKSSIGNGIRDIIEERKEVMRKSGLPYKEIQKVQEKYPDLDIGVVEYPVLGTITESAKVAIALSKRIDKPVVFGFQDEAWVVTKEDTPEKVQETFDKILEERRKAYWTPERVAEAKRKDEIETTARKAYAEVIYEGLPEEFKKYTDKEELVYDRESHILIAKDASILVAALKTEEEIRKWSDHPYDIPGLETDHSGGSMAGVVCTAIDYIKKNEAKDSSEAKTVSKKEISDTARKAYAEVVYKGLPEEFKKYADGEELVYDRATHIFIAKDAYILVTALKTEEEVRKWNDQPYDIPGLETDHSGGSMYGVVCTAIGHIREKEGRSLHTSVPKKFILDLYTDK